ncbi:MAG: hypothetical protein IT514_03705 [Burkholderiales bacterium]|nr:hypothetical protein [Burkholderiales bacterium]
MRHICLLVETLERSAFDFLEVQIGDLKVTLGKGPPGAPSPASAAPGPHTAPPAAAPAQLPAVAQAAAGAVAQAGAGALAQAATGAVARAGAGAAAADGEDGSVTVTAPMLGRFYAAPEPGAPPFVCVGARVDPGSTVGLIEVMKVFTAVQAGVHGVVCEVCAHNEQYVEYGQVLVRIRPVPVESGVPAAAATRVNPTRAPAAKARKGPRR